MSFVAIMKRLILAGAMLRALMYGLVSCSAEEFNDQIMLRVLDRLGDLMSVPIEACSRLERYIEMGGFENNMAPQDRKSIYHFLAMEMEELKIYMALEDGTFFMVEREATVISALYREPGNSGFIVNDTKTMNSDDPNYKHLISCVNSTNGEQTNCLLDGNSAQYIECVNECELIACANVESMNSTSLCQNYIITPKYDTIKRGYIPTTSYCVNKQAQPEQRPGYVLKDLITNEFGNCYYGDGITLVNRTLTGDYAFCGGNGSICSNTFEGGYSSFNYDPRFRDWYRSTKRSQTSIWTLPYGFTDNKIGITYTRPIYKSLSNAVNSSTTTDEERNVFHGVLAVDYYLQDITVFLQEQYSNSSMTIFLVERVGSNNMIASSIPNENYVTKAVLVANESISCPVESQDDTTLCTDIRVSITDLQQLPDPTSVIMYRAFMAHRDLDFPELQNINFKESDDVGSKAYISQMHSYTNSNLEWYVFVINPMTKSTSDSVMPGTSMFYVVIFVATLGFIACTYLFIAFYTRRKEKAMIHADWRFTSAFIMGCANLNLSSYTLLGANTNPSCMLRMWSFNGLFAVALAPLFVKVWRMSKLLGSSAGTRRTHINNTQAVLYTLPIIMTQILILAIFSIVDPPRQVEQLGVGDGMGVQQILCEQKSNAFFITQLVYDSCLIFVGCILAYRTKDIDPKFGESKQLGFSMYNLAFTGITAVTISKVVGLDHSSQIILQTVSVLWGSVFCSLAFVLPRLLQVQKASRPSSQVNTEGEQSYQNVNSVASNNKTDVGKRSVPYLSATWSTHVEETCPKVSIVDTEMQQETSISNDDKSKQQKTTLNVPNEEEEILFEEENSSCDSTANE